MSRAEKAKGYFLEGYNCSQSVAMAFDDLIGLDKKQIARLVGGFGGGVGRLREVCGTFSGVVFVMSALYGYDSAGDFEGKKHLYQEIQKLAEQFRDKNGSIVCRELLGLKQGDALSPVPEKRTQQYYKKRPCPELVYFSAQILEEYIKNKNE